MRTVIPAKLQAGRITQGPYGSGADFGTTGAFLIDGPSHIRLQIISSGAWDNLEWEHVSVSTKNRCPNWPETCFVKELFWDEAEVVMQLHPAKAEYVNHHPHCLHLWKPTTLVIPLPPRIMVEPKDGEL